jgi:hypothetical protein
MYRLIHCIDCSVIYAVTPFDQAPEYEIAEDESGFWAKERDDWADFQNQHKTHRKETITIIEGLQYSTGKYFDPLRITYFEATNGIDRFIIKRWRNSIKEPMRYELVQGWLDIKKSIGIQKTDLQKQIQWEIQGPPLSEQKIARFLEIVEEEALRLDLDKIFDELYETGDPQKLFLQLRESQIENILKKVQILFTQEEWQRIKRFVSNNRDWNGVMSFLIKENATISPKSYPI